MTTREIAQQYIADGWSVVPLVPGKKKAESKWNIETYGPEDFGPDYGIAGKCGAPSGHRVDVDLDHAMALSIASQLLPQTGLVHGRPGKPDSHYWFVCDGIKTTSFSDVKANGSKTLLEIRGTGGYTALPPSVHPSGETLAWTHHREPLILTPDSLYEAARGVALATLAAIHWPRQNRHHASAYLAGLLCHGGVHQTKVIEIIRAAATAAQDEEVADRIKYATATIGKFRKGEKVTGGPSLASIIGEDVVAKMRAWLKLADADALEEMNARHFWVRHGKHDAIGREDTADGRPVFQRPSALYSEYANRQIQVGVDEDGEPKLAPLFPTWLESKDRRTYREVVFAPPPRVADARDYNLWQGFAVEPDPSPQPEQRCALFLQHLHDVVCRQNVDHYRYIVRWMAHAVQCPGDPAEVALVLRGIRGAGKGVVVEAGLGPIFGSHFVHLDRVEDLTGFNSLISGRVLVFADEAFWAGDKRQHSVLKRLITAPTLRITLKGIDSHTEPSCLHLISATNEEHSIPAGFHERRFCALNVSDHRRGDIAYFAAIHQELNHGGRNALLAYLLSVPVTKRDLLEQCPVTEELKRQQHESMEDWQAWLFELLNDAEVGTLVWPTDDAARWVKASDFYQSYLGHVGGKPYRLTKDQLGKRISSVISAKKSDKRRLNGELVRAWDTRPLAEARRAFDALRGSSDWDELPDGYRGKGLVP